LKQAEADFNRLLASQSRTTRPLKRDKQAGTKSQSLSRKNSPRQKANQQAPTMTGTILKTLEAAPKQTFSPRQLADRLAIKNINSLTATLLRLAQNRRIRKVAVGAYAAKEPPPKKPQHTTRKTSIKP
jgi:hypothetical protein